MSDSRCQQKLIELQLLLKALFNTRSTRESIRDPGAKTSSLANCCKGCSHQTVFGSQIGVFPAVSPEDVKVGPHPVSIVSQALKLALREGLETWLADGDGNCFWRSLSLNICKSQCFHRLEKLVVFASAAENVGYPVSKDYHIHNTTYYDSSVVQTFVGTECATQHEWMLLDELFPLCANDGRTGWITASSASEALGCIVKFIHPVSKKARVKKDARVVFRGRSI